MMKSYLNQTATWKKVITDAVTGEIVRDRYGQPTFEEGISIPVRWEGKMRLVKNAKGQEVVSEARVFCDVAISPEDIITYGGRDYSIINFTVLPSFTGTSVYREVYC